MPLTAILLVQFRASVVTASLEQESISRELGPGIQVRCISALDENIPWQLPAEVLIGIDGVIFGGSGDYDFDGGRLRNDVARSTSYVFLEKLRPLLDHIFLHDVPTLGICYGHQIIGAYAGGAGRK